MKMERCHATFVIKLLNEVPTSGPIILPIFIDTLPRGILRNSVENWINTIKKLQKRDNFTDYNSDSNLRVRTLCL